MTMKRRDGAGRRRVRAEGAGEVTEREHERLGEEEQNARSRAFEFQRQEREHLYTAGGVDGQKTARSRATRRWFQDMWEACDGHGQFVIACRPVQA